MSTALPYKSSSFSQETERLDEMSVLRALNDFCVEHGPGAVVPSHTEWMQRLGTTERAVRWALAELQRQGKILRRQGARTLVAEGIFGANGYAERLASESASVPVSISSRTVVAIANPDGSFFDRGVELLFHQTQKAALSYVFRPHQAGEVEEQPEESPLGYLIFGLHLLPLAVKLQGLGRRVVVLGTPALGTSLNVPHVHGDQEQGGYLATKHLIDLGHRRLSIWGSAALNLSQRFAGYERAVLEARKNGVAVETTSLEILWEKWRSEPEIMQAYFANPNAPTGILVWNDHQAISLMSFFSYLGIRVPQQVSVVGYDNLPESAHSHPSLSTVNGGLDLQLQEALAILTATTPVAPDHTVVVPPVLICRDSSTSFQSSAQVLT